MVTTYEILFDENRSFDCSYCINKLTARNPAIRTARFCDTMAVEKPCNFIDLPSVKISYYRCVGNFKDNEAEYAIRLFHDYKQGMLPESGGLLDQSGKLADVFGILYSIENRLQKEHLKKLKNTRK